MTERLESIPARPAAHAAAEESDRTRLRGDLGTFDIVVMVLAYAGPLAVVGLFMSFVIGYGVGPATPLMFVLVTLSLCLFSVGYVAMSRRLPRPGALYTYVTAGLGQPIGLSAGLLAILSYCFFGVAYHAGLAIVLQALLADLGGPVIAWPILVIGSLLLTLALGHFRIALSARILTALMVAEVTAILIWDTAVFIHGGPEGRPLNPLATAGLSEGSMALALLLAAVGFVGFESTAVFRDEMRDPDRTVPRATYLAVVCIGGFYVLAAWAAVVAYGPGAVKTAAYDDPAGFFTSSVQTYLGSVAVHVMSVMVVMSYLAGAISEQNILSRYFHSLGADGVLPRAVGRVHQRHGSPFVANIVTTAVLLLLFVPWVSADAPTTPYAVLSAAGLVTLDIVLALASFGVLAYFRRGDVADGGIWRTLLAPLAAGLLLSAATVLGVLNFEVISGDAGPLSVALLVIGVATAMTGLVAAAAFRRWRPGIYRRIGRSPLEPPA
jgi:amino acid transporter